MDIQAAMSIHGVYEKSVSETVEWYTPPDIFDRLGLAFDLDVASPGADVVPWVPATTHYTKDDNGLAQPWHGLVWCNPPYGAMGLAFARRMVKHNNGVLLLASRTETEAFQFCAKAASYVAFPEKRIYFIRSDSFSARPAFGSVMFAFGEPAHCALRNAGFGWGVDQL